MKPLSGTAYVILGMLSLGAQTGYDIKRIVDHSIRFFWAASYGQIYPELAGSRTQAWSRGSSPTGARKRKEYRLTDQGRAELTALARAAAEMMELRDENLLKLFFADALPRRAGARAAPSPRRARAVPRTAARDRSAARRRSALRRSRAPVRHRLRGVQRRLVQGPGARLAPTIGEARHERRVGDGAFPRGAGSGRAELSRHLPCRRAAVRARAVRTRSRLLSRVEARGSRRWDRRRHGRNRARAVRAQARPRRSACARLRRVRDGPGARRPRCRQRASSIWHSP